MWLQLIFIQHTCQIYLTNYAEIVVLTFTNGALQQRKEVLEGAISCPGNSWAFFSATREIPSPKCSLKQQAAKLYFFRGGEVKLLNLALWARMICSTLQLPSNRTHDQTFCSPSVKPSSSRWTRASLFAAAASPSTSTDPSGKTFRPGWTRSIESSPTGNGVTTLPVRLDLEF